MLVDEVDAAVVGQLHDPGDDVLGAVVDALVHAELPRALELLVARGVADHERAGELASWTAAEPMPLPTELTITVSPARSLPRVNSMCQEVANATCSAAAASSETPSGMRIRFRA